MDGDFSRRSFKVKSTRTFSNLIESTNKLLTTCLFLILLDKECRPTYCLLVGKCFHFFGTLRSYSFIVGRGFPGRYFHCYKGYLHDSKLAREYEQITKNRYSRYYGKSVACASVSMIADQSERIYKSYVTVKQRCVYIL